MAKGKKRSRRQGMVSKAINIGLIALGFSRVIEILIDPKFGSISNKFKVIQRDATFGLSEGKFNMKAGLRMYTPAGAAVGLGTLKSYLMKKFPVRR